MKRIIILISIDGLNPKAIQNLGQSKLPNIYKIRTNGLFTDNARTDLDSTKTLPNHISMFTSFSSKTHSVKFNSDKGINIHQHNSLYITSLFDKLHTNGLCSNIYVGKNKFNFIKKSYDSHIKKYFHDPTVKFQTNQGEIIIGKKEISKKYKPIPIIKQFIKDYLQNSFCNFTFIHFSGTDLAGHFYGWCSKEYYYALRAIDRDIGALMKFFNKINQKYIMIITSDHGGGDPDFGHSNSNSPKNFIIPFYVYRTDKIVDYSIYDNDLYNYNSSRTKPNLNSNPKYKSKNIPIRNSDIGNLIAKLFDLTSIKSSNINSVQDLKI